MIELQHLRDLTVDPSAHPRGQPHLSAASGLVCLNGHVYVVADDEHHLAVFRDGSSGGALFRLFEGDLPHPIKERKKLKPDLETLMALPADKKHWPHGALLALGSGSRPNRQTGVVVELGADGMPSAPPRLVDLQPLYEALHQRFDELNIEGAMFAGKSFILLQRGNAGGSKNAAIVFRRRDVLALIRGKTPSKPLRPKSIRIHKLGRADGVRFGFTDAAGLPDGRWVFTAVAENTDNPYDDAACCGAAIGIVKANGRLGKLHRLTLPHKIEGVDARVVDGAIELCLVTDSDDPKQTSSLLLARLPDPR